MAMVCPNCGVYCREEREARDEQGNLFSSWAVCAYCKCPELQFKDDAAKPPPTAHEANQNPLAQVFPELVDGDGPWPPIVVITPAKAR